MAGTITRTAICFIVSFSAVDISDGDESGRMLECATDDVWTHFKMRLKIAVDKGDFATDGELLQMAQLLIQPLAAQDYMSGAEMFYQNLCSDSEQTFCLYGAVNALFVVAAGMQMSSVSGADPAGQKHAREYLQTATTLLGLQYCLDFIESTSWPIRTNDILANLNRSRHQPFELATGIGNPDAMLIVPPGSSLHNWLHGDLVEKLSIVNAHSEQPIAVVAIGTHPTLTSEAVVMLREFAFGPEQAVHVRRTFGITYKCDIFPDMCVGTSETNSMGPADPIADLIGPFEAPPPYERYTLSEISARLSQVAAEMQANYSPDVLVCTSPFIVCALLQDITGLPLMAYLGLPLLWKRPTDHFDNSTARARFWELFAALASRPNVVLAVNNPLLSEQISYQALDTRLPVVRPHAIFTHAVYVPTRLTEALLISRTKFMWVTLGCALRHYTPEKYPIDFKTLNTDARLSFKEMASFRSVVLVPWEHALMAFFEFYSMNVPLLMPDASWSYRLVFDAEGNLGSTTSQYVDVRPDCDPMTGCNSVKHPYAPFTFASLQSRKYWFRYSSFSQFPHVHTFTSIPDLLQKLINIDLAGTSGLMKAFNERTLIHTAAFWRQVGRVLLRGQAPTEHR